MVKITRNGKSVSGGALWHVTCKGKFMGHVVEICSGDLYAVHYDAMNPGTYEITPNFHDILPAFFSRV